jgi:prepilin-type N-terminal cleavage/methylation domain-containing protein/prepilin-type processing-associated H-X9-DG protein
MTGPSLGSTRSRRSSGFTLIELLVVIAIIGVLVGLLLPAVQKVREAANRLRCQNNLKQLGIAVHLYHDGNQCLPMAAGYGGNSATWLVSVLPYLEQSGMAAKYQLSQPGYSQASSGCTGNQLNIATCPSDMAALKGGQTLGGTAYHNYACNVGNTAVGTPTGAGNMRTETSYYGNTFAGAPFTYGTGQTLTQITDGTSSTLMLAEVIQGQRQDLRGLIYWTSAAGFVTSLRPNDSNGDQVTHGICDQNPPNPPANCPGVVTGGYAIRAFAARSRHTGGVNVAFCDGSVRFIANTVDVLAWQELGTSQGGEVIQGDY